MHTAVFVGFKPLIESIDLDEGGKLTVTHGADPDRAIEEIRSSRPRLVVVSSAVDELGPGTFLERILEQLPDFRRPVVRVETGPEPQPLKIYEWNEDRGEFEERSAPHEHLRHEISRLCAALPAKRAETESIRDIGYYDYIEQGGEFFHVQTEIIPKTPPVIQTTVLKGGTIVDSTSSECAGDDNAAERLTEMAKAQHDRILGKVNHGDYS